MEKEKKKDTLREKERKKERDNNLETVKGEWERDMNEKCKDKNHILFSNITIEKIQVFQLTLLPFLNLQEILKTPLLLKLFNLLV